MMGSQPIKIQLRKILQENLVGNSCGKSCGKLLRENHAEKSCRRGRRGESQFKKGSDWWKFSICNRMIGANQSGSSSGKSYGKILWEILAGKSCGKLLWEIFAGNAVGKSCGNSCGKLLREMLWEILLGILVGNLAGRKCGGDAE